MSAVRRDHDVRRWRRLTTLAVCALGLSLPAAVRADVQAFGVPTLHKVLPDEARGADWSEGSVSIESARNERESFQVVVRSGEPVADVSAVVEDLRGPGGATLLASRLDVHKVEWIDVGTPEVGNAPPGTSDLRPDPLPPVDLERDHFDLQPGRNLVLWLTLDVPEAARSGTYSGRIQFWSADRPVAEIRLRALVRSFALPRRPALQSLVGLAERNILRVHGATTREDKERVVRLYLEEYIRARLSPFLYGPENLAFGPLPESQIRWQFTLGADGKPTGDLTIDFSGFDREGARYLDGRSAFSAFNFAPYLIRDERGKSPVVAFTDSKGVTVPRLMAGGTVDPVFERLATDFFRRVAAHLAEKGWLDRAVYYVWDEPGERHLESMKIVAGLVRKADPRIRTATTYDPAHLSRLRELEQEGRSLISIWIPYVSDYHETAANEQRRKGADYWLYDVMDYNLITRNGEQNRAIFWKVWRHGAHGYLYYFSTWWGPESVWTRPSFRLPGSGYHYRLGDGFFFYPPERSATVERPILDRVVPSVRWELMREGVEDYEYLHLLDQLLAEASRRAPGSAPVKRARAVLEHARDLAERISLDGLSYPLFALEYKTGGGWSSGDDRHWLMHEGGAGPGLRITIPKVKPGRYVLKALVYRDPAYIGHSFSRFRMGDRQFVAEGPKGHAMVELGEIEARGGTFSFTVAPVEGAGVIFYRFLLKPVSGPAARGVFEVRREIAEAIEGLLAAKPKAP